MRVRKIIRKNMQKPSHNKFIQMRFLLQMANQRQKRHRRRIRCQSLILLIKKGRKEGKASKKNNKKNMQNPSQYQFRKMKFLLQMGNI